MRSGKTTKLKIQSRQQTETQLSNVSARMRAALLETAVEMVNQGRLPSVTELAHEAGVSRATAYRHFPTRARLIADLTDFSLGPVRSWISGYEDGVDRVMELFENTFPRFKEYETQLRAALLLSLEHQLLAQAGALKEDQYKRGFRRNLLTEAAKPLKATLGKRRFDRLIRALSLIYGIESYVVFKDIWDSSTSETEATARWMAQALLKQALAEAGVECPLD
jgi:AcrR family transcriptional regulator